MARATAELIQALLATAAQLESGESYQWGHMGSCNCGHLAQTITHKTKAEIHEEALKRYGDWQHQVRDYCPQSGLPIDHIIEQMLALGLTTQDLSNLERLSDREVLAALPPKKRFLRHNHRDDVVLYLQTWAALLEQQLYAKPQLEALLQQEKTNAG